MQARLLIVLAIMLLLAGCAVSDTAKIKQTTKKYNDKLATALEQGDIMVLKEYATERQMGKVQVFITQLQQSNQLMKAGLVRIKFTEARKITDQEAAELLQRRRERLEKEKVFVIPYEVKNLPHALVKTEERWLYTTLDSRTGQPVEGSREVSYQVSYLLVMKDNRWLVDNVDPLEVAAKK